ncbi:Methyltransferase [Alteracholeplasma palmae J233]|uniref:Methyltransferase n=1 Tax=Alteracholeplasma palmae (strain ATCC 49389 / J233) TaxID=1318466 RepID=U4KRA0_ALTPJ|nr:class I SAM-dependent methyltransferase [Alteracholeplasma palmae]CCV63976.1 Methyltransferase [Alteracholeplasma palmae J233]
MKQVKIIDIAHKILKDHISKDDIIIDATVGNGYDTLFLASICKHVYGFDIQEKAIHETQTKTKDLRNVTLIHDSFENITLHVDKFNGVIFNLGYLPNGDKSITTLKDTTHKTINQLLNLNNIFILIVVYPGHEEGYLESMMLKDLFSTISTPVLKIEIENRENAPYIYFVNNR